MRHRSKPIFDLPSCILGAMQLMLLGLIAQTHAEEIDFNRDVRPILSDKCYYCHGPDEENRKADLRLDIREEAIDMIEAGEIISRIHDDDSDVRMPPPESNLSLTAEEKKRWSYGSKVGPFMIAIGRSKHYRRPCRSRRQTATLGANSRLIIL